MRTFVLIGYASPYAGWDYGVHIKDVMRKFAWYEVFRIGAFTSVTWHPGRLKGDNR